MLVQVIVCLYEIYLDPHVVWTPCFMIFRPFVGLPVICIPNAWVKILLRRAQFLQPLAQDLSPNSITNHCHFQVFCEVYLQTEPTVLLFWEFFYINHQTEFKDGPSIELGGISQGLEQNLVLL